MEFKNSAQDGGSVASASTFGSKTFILTPDGPVFVDDLRAGDLVLTHSNGPQPLQNVVHTVPDRVVCIRAEAFGRGLPWRPVMMDAKGYSSAHATPTVGDTSLPYASKACFFQLQFGTDQIIWAEGVPVHCKAVGAKRSLPIRKKIADHRLATA